jgi:hypothetical protein
MRAWTGSLLRRAGGGLSAAGVTAVLLTGCGGAGSGDDAGASAGSSPSATPTPVAELSDGLLPAAAFGPQATVVAVPVEQLRAGAGLAAMGQDLTVTPEACAAAVRSTQPDLDAFDDVAGVSATSGATVTVEMLLAGGPTDGVVEKMSRAVTTCPQVQISAPGMGKATVAFVELPVDDLGDGAAALQYTTSATQPDGTQVRIPALVGAVEDGDRLVVLVSLAQPGGVPAAGGEAGGLDPAAFADLLRKAYETQADALG